MSCNASVSERELRSRFLKLGHSLIQVWQVLVFLSERAACLHMLIFRYALCQWQQLDGIRLGMSKNLKPQALSQQLLERQVAKIVARSRDCSERLRT